VNDITLGQYFPGNSPVHRLDPRTKILCIIVYITLIFCIKNMIIEYELRRITIDGKEIHLTQTEYNIVELLSVHTGRVLTYSEIIKKIWGYSDTGSIKKLQVNMANIRKKFGEKPGEYLYILNELGVGYRMNGEGEE
jgi:two-component system KDP operon response regulator KdpE